MSNLMENWMGVVQYNKENPGAFNITGLCQIMEEQYAFNSIFDSLHEQL